MRSKDLFGRSIPPSHHLQWNVQSLRRHLSTIQIKKHKDGDTDESNSNITSEGKRPSLFFSILQYFQTLPSMAWTFLFLPRERARTPAIFRCSRSHPTRSWSVCSHFRGRTRDAWLARDVSVPQLLSAVCQCMQSGCAPQAGARVRHGTCAAAGWRTVQKCPWLKACVHAMIYSRYNREVEIIKNRVHMSSSPHTTWHIYCMAVNIKNKSVLIWMV